MLATGALQRHALKSTVVNGTNPLLPFLYCTRTIVRSYAEVKDDGHPEEQHASTRKTDREADRWRMSRPGFRSVRLSETAGLNNTRRHKKKHEKARVSKARDLKDADSVDRDHRQTRDQQSRDPQKQKHAKPEPYIPFERKSARVDPYADLEGSTITPGEKKAFDALFKLQKESSTTLSVSNAGQSDDSSESTSLDSILASAVPSSASSDATTEVALDSRGRPVAQLPPALVAARQRELARRDERRLKEGTGEKEQTTQAQEIQKAAEKELHSVRQAMKKAETDVEVWQILFKRVVERVLALGLDGPSDEVQIKEKKRQDKAARRKKTASRESETELEQADVQNHSSPSLATAELQDSESGRTIQVTGGPQGPGPDVEEHRASNGLAPAPDPKKPTELQIVTLTFPELLLFTARHLSYHFPSSPLPLALLPTIRDLGPTTAALGISTPLYNNHINLLWTHYSDIPAIISTMEEMDKQVFEFDHTTTALIRKILSWSGRARKGDFGESVQVLWDMDRMLGGARELWRWLRVVQQRRNDAALRRAREVEDLGYDSLEEEKKVRFMKSKPVKPED